jgi:hypothetical protein
MAGKLQNFSFVGIFDEMRKAGSAEIVMRGGKLPLKETVLVFSIVRGMYCAELQTLLIDSKACQIVGDGMEWEVEGAPKAHIKAVRGVTVTDAVRHLSGAADEWHTMCAQVVRETWRDLNPEDETTAASSGPITAADVIGGLMDLYEKEPGATVDRQTNTITIDTDQGPGHEH